MGLLNYVFSTQHGAIIDWRVLGTALSYQNGRDPLLAVSVLLTQKPVGAMRLVTVCCFELNLISILQTILKGMGSLCMYIHPFP
jgi:hypothetical protein